MGTATVLPQNFVSIGGYHIDNTVKPLPEVRLFKSISVVIFNGKVRLDVLLLHRNSSIL